MGDSLKRLREASGDIRSEAGYQMELLQRGEMPTDFKQMPDVGSGVMEIRLHCAGEYRVFYVAKFEEAIYVLHCFEKKSRTTRGADLDIGRQRYKELLNRRRSR